MKFLKSENCAADTIFITTAFFQSLSRLFLPTHFVKSRRTVRKMNSRGPYISKFKKRNKISSLLVYVLHKTGNYSFSPRSRAKTAKKCTKKCDARAKLLLCLTNLLFFDVRVATRRWILKSLMRLRAPASRKLDCTARFITMTIVLSCVRLGNKQKNMLTSVSYVCLGMCAGLWVISGGIYLCGQVIY